MSGSRASFSGIEGYQPHPHKKETAGGILYRLPPLDTPKPYGLLLHEDVEALREPLQLRPADLAQFQRRTALIHEPMPPHCR